MVKKILCIFICLLITISNVNFVFANSEIETINNIHDNNLQEKVNEEEIKYDDIIDYIYIENSNIFKGNIENIAIGIKDKYNIENVKLIYNDGTNQYTEEYNKLYENTYLFSVATNQIGRYSLESISFLYNGSNYIVELNDQEEIYFTVDEEDSMITNEYSDIISLNSNTYETIEDGLSDLVAKKVKTNDNVVICLDPGHDNTHAGAYNATYDIHEEQYNLEIAKACRDELETYNNVEVIMTRNDNGDCPYPGTSSGDCNKKRVENASKLGADIYVALHLNTTGTADTSASGAEVYVSNYKAYHDDASKLAENILKNLSALGLKNRGVKVRNTEDKDDYYYEDGSIKDYYGIIKNGVTYGVNSLIVEHAFINNSSDANVIKNRTKELGVADAKSLAEYFGLTKGVYSLSTLSPVASQKITVNVNTHYIDSGYNQGYQLIGCNITTDQVWETLTDYSTSTSFSWTPKAAGQYILGIRAKNSKGETKDYIIWGYVNVIEPQFNINTVNVTKNDNTSYKIKADVTKNIDELNYEFLVYNIAENQWNTIQNGKSNECIWKPNKNGDYLVGVRVSDSLGNQKEEFIGWHIDGVTIQTIELQGFTWLYKDEEIQIGTAYTTNDKATFTWKSYNLDTKQWETIVENTASNWISWKPKKGNYWIYVEAKTSDGTTTNQVMCMAVGKDYNKIVTKINGITVGNLVNGIVTLNANVTSNDKNLTYKFQAYCTTGNKEWITITSNSKSATVSWKPEEEGTYLLYLEVIGDEGKVYTYSMGCEVKGKVVTNSFSSNKPSSQSIYTNITLTGDSTIEGIGSYKQQILVYDGTDWQEISQSTRSVSSELKVLWTPTKAMDYLLCYQITSPTGEVYQTFMGYSITELHEIMGTSSVTVNQMVNLYKKSNSTYDVFSEGIYNGSLASGGAPTIEDFCKIFLEEANAEGVRAEVAFAQAMLETGYLKFGGDVKPNQYNFAGLGATGNGVSGNKFKNVREGIRAQIQHLKCYASTDPLKNECVDQRWSNSLRGKAKYIEYLSIPNNPYGVGWAASSTYAESIIKLINMML